MLGQRLRRWPNIEPTLEKYTMFAKPSRHKTFVERLYNVGRTSSTFVQHCIKTYKCSVFTGCRGVNPFRDTRSNTVSLFAG